MRKYMYVENKKRDAVSVRVRAQLTPLIDHLSLLLLPVAAVQDLLKPYVAPSAAASKSDRSTSDSAASRDPALAGDLPVREDGSGRVFVAGLSETKLDSLSTFSKAYSKGLSNRRVAATKLNAHSSRSHSMAVVRLEFRSQKAPHKRITARIQMLDLAGNEDNRHSGNTASKSRMNESSKINNSLFVLGKVINGLNSKENRIPYRDSKLTRLLQGETVAKRKQRAPRGFIRSDCRRCGSNG
jgi:hypothetical protein